MYINTYNHLHRFNGLRRARIPQPPSCLDQLYGDPFRRCLIGHWKSIGNVAATGPGYDLSGNGNDGTLHHNAYIDSAGFNFDGVADALIVPTSPTMSFTGNITINLWVKVNNTTAMQSLVSRWNTISDEGHAADYFTRIYNNQVQFGILNSAWSEIDVSFSSTSWSMLTFVYDAGTSMNIGINGVMNTPLSTSRVLLDDGFDTSIGGLLYNNNYSWPLDGIIDDIRIYNRVLSAQEIKQIYYATKGRY